MSIPKRKPRRWYDFIVLKVIPPLSALVIKLLMLSCRVVKEEGREKSEKVLFESGGKVVYASWHQRIPYHLHHLGSRHVRTMISLSRDGEYTARTAAWLGFKSARGSSTRRGSGALKEIVQRIREGDSGGMLPDGPQGPARKAKMGAVIIARDAEAPLFPILWGADRCWVLNSWDRMLIPKPFARIALCYAEPILVPSTATGEKLETYRHLLEERLNQAARWCDEQFGVERPWRKVPKPGTPEIGPLTE
jgi:lysophospholipid acyltransferase (LPLAT)-like uncharacterized protein